MSAEKIDKEKMGQRIARRVLESGLRSGELQLKGKSPEQVSRAMRGFLRKVLGDIDSGTALAITIDYTDDLLRDARAMLQSGKREFACLLYATWFEHMINSFLYALAWRQGMDEDDIHSLLREASFRAKSSWLLYLLARKKFAPKHFRLLGDLAELRNWFVHYKWRGRNPDKEDPRKVKIKDVLSQVESTVSYVKRFEARVIFSSQKGRLRSLTR